MDAHRQEGGQALGVVVVRRRSPRLCSSMMRLLLILGAAHCALLPSRYMVHHASQRRLRSHGCSACAGSSDEDELLRRRMEKIEQKEKLAEAESISLLQSRLADIASGDEQERALYAKGCGALPVVCMDAMVPRQRFEIDTDDPTLCRLLRDIGLGGIFVMLSLNPKQRKCRRSGVVVRVVLCDALRERDGTPTAVRASLVGRRRVRVLGASEGLETRIGRFRRGYDDYTSDPALGWGFERFVNRPSAQAEQSASGAAAAAASGDVWMTSGGAAAAFGKSSATEPSEPSLTLVEVLYDEDEAALYEAGSACEQLKDTSAALPPTTPPTPAPTPPAPTPPTPAPTPPTPPASTAASPPPTTIGEIEADAARLAASLDRWLELARDVRTYDNTDVVASARAEAGKPGLRIDPAVLLDRVVDDIGPQPPTSSPTALALWGAALINPLPALGVSPECRGSVLEAGCAADRLTIVQRAVNRSIANLEGEVPLG